MLQTVGLLTLNVSLFLSYVVVSCFDRDLHTMNFVTAIVNEKQSCWLTWTHCVGRASSETPPSSQEGEDHQESGPKETVQAYL